MIMYHGTSNSGAEVIRKNGFIKNEAPLSINNEGKSCYINAVFMSPHKEIAHEFETNNRPNSKGNTGNPRIIELELNSRKIFDLTKKKNQDKIINYLGKNKNLTVNNFLIENNFDGVKQIHKNYFGKIRLEYAIINLNVLKILNIPKKSTKIGILYAEAMLPDVLN